MEEINVQLLDMDTKIPEQLVKNDDDSYTIFLNARLSQESHLKSYFHALEHIRENDFEKENVQQIEAEAHNILIPYNAERIPSDKFRKRLAQLRRERERIQQELQEREEEIEFLIRANGNTDFLFNSAEHHKFYGWL